MIDLTKITNNVVTGRYLDPRATFGWNKEMLTVLSDTMETYDDLASLLEEFGCGNFDKFTHDGMTDGSYENAKAIANSIANHKEKLIMPLQFISAGNNLKVAYQKAVKQINQEFSKYYAEDHINKTAYRWEALNPKTVKAVKVDDFKRNYHKIFIYWIHC